MASPFVVVVVAAVMAIVVAAWWLERMARAARAAALHERLRVSADIRQRAYVIAESVIHDAAK